MRIVRRVGSRGASESSSGLAAFTWTAVVGLLLAAACSTSQPSIPRSDTEFWAQLRISGLEAERFDTLADLVASADAVVVGEFASFGLSRTLEGDAAEDVVVYAKADLWISETIAGRSFGESVPLEFLLPVGPAEADGAIDALRAALPGGRLVVFLRDKGGEEAGLFRVVNSTGLWAETARAAVDAPLAEEPPSKSGIYESELAGVASIEDLIEVVESYSV